jgi:hypothetical protein
MRATPFKESTEAVSVLSPLLRIDRDFNLAFSFILAIFTGMLVYRNFCTIKAAPSQTRLICALLFVSELLRSAVYLIAFIDDDAKWNSII